MRLVDANILVYAFTTSFPQHERARAWLDERLSDAVPLGMPWQSLVAFVRLVSNQRLFERPVSVATAWRQVTDWLALRTGWTAFWLAGLALAPNQLDGQCLICDDKPVTQSTDTAGSVFVNGLSLGLEARW